MEECRGLGFEIPNCGYEKSVNTIFDVFENTLRLSIIRISQVRVFVTIVEKLYDTVMYGEHKGTNSRLLRSSAAT